MPSVDEGRTNRLTIYMIKPKFQQVDEIVEPASKRIPVDDVGHFVFEDSHPKPPAWITSFFGNGLAANLPLITSSAKGLFLLPVRQGNKTIQFAIAFGTGRHLLQDGVVEERFGLKAVLNSVARDSFRSIDKTTLGSIPKHTREQMSRNVAPAEFGIDIEQDLVSAVTAKSSEPRLGKIISGKDALYVSVPVNKNNAREFLTLCLGRYRSKDYKREFDWIDQISEVRDALTEEALNSRLVQKLNQGQLENVWMAVPDLVDWAPIAGFRHVRAKRAELLDDLELVDFLREFPNGSLTIDNLRSDRIFAIGRENDEPVHKWSAFQCTYAEVDLNQRKYILNNRKWYQIAPSFVEEIREDFLSMEDSGLDLPEYQGGSELDYNTAASRNLGNAYCMDQELVVHGGGHNRIEFCDILTKDRKLIHVKKYGGSSVLSHLFSQGAVSGELFVSDRSFREALNRKLPRGYELPAQGATKPDAARYEIVYAVIQDSQGSLDMPFFSKISLRNDRRRLTSFGYKVTKKKIQSAE